MTQFFYIPAPLFISSIQDSVRTLLNAFHSEATTITIVQLFPLISLRHTSLSASLRQTFNTQLPREQEEHTLWGEGRGTREKQNKMENRK